jgi:hypothetical protein
MGYRGKMRCEVGENGVKSGENESIVGIWWEK